MNALIMNPAAVLTMSSREIADLTSKQHQHVKRDIEKMFAELQEDVSKFGRIYRDSMNRQQIEYQLDRELTETLLTGYSALLRRKVIARWRLLEAGAQHTPQVPTTFAGALLLAAQQAAQIEQQQTQLALAAPKVAFVDRYVDSTGLKGFREVAKLLRANEARFSEFLIENKVMYRLNRRLVAYQQHIDAGRFAVKTGTCQHSNHAFAHCQFTPKGVEWIAGLWAVHQLRELDQEGI